MLCTVGALLASAALLGADVPVSQADSLGSLSLAGNARMLTPTGPIRLTDAVDYQSGAAWIPSSFSLAQDFHAQFSFVLGSGGGLGGHADGITFTVQGSADGTHATGDDGGGIGYEGLSPSFAVAFDDFENTNDSDANHVEILQNGSVTDDFIAGPTDPPLNLYGQMLTAWIDYSAASGTLSVYLAASASKPATALITTTVPDTVDPSVPYWAGVTSATGMGYETADLTSLNWQVSAATPPRNTSPPTVSGEDLEGYDLTGDPGSWSGYPSSYAYQWLDCDSAGQNCTPVDGATSELYTVQASDADRTIALKVTATTAAGLSASAVSAPTGTMIGLPVRLTAPKLSDDAPTVGETLTVTAGDWRPATAQVDYSWQDCDPDSLNCTLIDGANSNSYTVTQDDIGETIQAVVTATDDAGQTEATSEPTSPVPDPGGSGGNGGGNGGGSGGGSGGNSGVDPTPPARADGQLAIAQEHAPELFFDSSERWAPLDVDRYLLEGSHYLCSGDDGLGCPDKPIRSLSDLSASQAAQNANMFSGGIAEGEDLGYYRSPRAECTKNYQDCNSGDQSKIYAHVVPEDRMLYIDYWIFYRFNDAPDSAVFFDQHQGDWEGLTVGVSQDDPNGPFIDALYRQHEGPAWMYLRQVLTCGADKHKCTNTDTRPDGYPAAGTHATYARACSRDWPWECQQTNVWWKPDHGRNGSRPWGNNNDPSAVALLDWCFGTFNSSCRNESWDDWNGNWNGLEWADGFHHGVYTPDVASPAARGHLAEYNDPGLVNGGPKERPQCENPAFGCDAQVATAASVALPAPCRQWLGPDVSALACDPGKLQAALHAGTLGTGGGLTVTGAVAAAGSDNGLTQAVGAPLAAGQSVQIAGRASGSTELFALTRVGATVRTVAFAHPALSGAPVTITATRSGTATLARRGGAPVAGTVISVVNTSAPAAPAKLSASRQGKQIVVSLRGSGKVAITLTDAKGKALAARLISAHGNVKVTFKLIRGASGVKAATITATGASSKPVSARIATVRKRTTKRSR